jgi:hypothetical protein
MHISVVFFIRNNQKKATFKVELFKSVLVWPKDLLEIAKFANEPHYSLVNNAI